MSNLKASTCSNPEVSGSNTVYILIAVPGPVHQRGQVWPQPAGRSCPCTATRGQEGGRLPGQPPDRDLELGDEKPQPASWGSPAGPVFEPQVGMPPTPTACLRSPEKWGVLVGVGLFGVGGVAGLLLAWHVLEWHPDNCFFNWLNQSGCLDWI